MQEHISASVYADPSNESDPAPWVVARNRIDSEGAPRLEVIGRHETEKAAMAAALRWVAEQMRMASAN